MIDLQGVASKYFGLVVAAVCAAVVTWPAPEATAQLGPIVQVNDVTNGSYSAVAMGADGRVVAVWEGGSPGRINGRVFASDWSPLTPELILFDGGSTVTIGRPSVAVDATGDFVVVWYEWGPSAWDDSRDGDGAGVFGRVFLPTGTPWGADFQVNTTTTDNQVNPQVAIAPGGDFMVVWLSDDLYYDVFGQAFWWDGASRGSEFEVSENAPFGNHDGGFDVDFEPTGTYLVAFTSSDGCGASGPGSYKTFLQRISASGGLVGGAHGTDCLHHDPHISVEPDGGVLAAWTYGQRWGTGDGPFMARRFNSNLSPDGDEFTIMANPENDDVDMAGVTLNDGGDFVVAWSQWEYTYSYPYTCCKEFLVQWFDAQNGAVNSPFVVASYPDYYGPWSRYQASSGTPSGDFVVLWQHQEAGSSDILGRLSVPAVLFADGFESGDSSAWAAAVP